jgi:acetylornithine deacetylase/succinyl-diaminopimelate desuccinylase-like protein
LDTRNQALHYASVNNNLYLDLLKSFLRIPSISTESEKVSDVKTCAIFVADTLKSLGIENVDVFTTPLHPIIYGDYLHAGKDQPTILIYGHYDVQPVDPIELWNKSPFDPTIDRDYLFARGSSDMKGQVIACLAAIDSIMKTGSFPINLKFLFEGEEEIGSPSLRSFLESHKVLLASDVALNPDTGMIGKDIPTIVYGLRGLSYFELRIFGPDRDLHSGVFGGVVHNPAQVLADLISGMHDNTGRVTLPGFYDSVLPLSDLERKELARLNMDDAYYKKQTGVEKVWGENGFTAVERIGGRPTLEVNGLLSGFTGQGAKTVLPAKAMAKLSTRLVPNQKPDEIYGQLSEYLKNNAPPTVRWELEQISLGSPSISDINMPETQALAIALETVWGKKPTYKREGGSVPVVADMQQILGIDSVLTGFGLPDDNIHSPNEKLHLPTWQKGILALIHFFFNVENNKKLDKS